MPTTLKFLRRNLPHWLVADRSYFVTIRLQGTLPKSIVMQLREERELLQEDRSDPEVLLELQRRHFIKIERILDAVDDQSWLSKPDIAQMVLNNLDWLRSRGWKIYAAVVMSTHLHLLMRSENGRSSELLDDLGHFKRFTARKANHLLSRKGPFWAREDFDHWIRDRAKFEGTIGYILNNPVKAGLVKHWREWSWYCLDASIEELIYDGSPDPRPAG